MREPYRHSSYGSYPWAVRDGETGAGPLDIATPNSVDDGPSVLWIRFFRRRKDAQAAIDANASGALYRPATD